jgi:hypothetical protein
MIAGRVHVAKALEFPAGYPETLAIIDGYDNVPVFHGYPGTSTLKANSMSLRKRVYASPGSAISL